MTLDPMRAELLAQETARAANRVYLARGSEAHPLQTPTRMAPRMRAPRTKTEKTSAISAARTGGMEVGPVIRTTGVTKRYALGKGNEVAALRGASIEIERGEMVAIVGQSGSGKSTLMHLLGCLDRPDAGRIFVNGRRVDNLRGAELTKVRSTEIGFIFQGFNLIPTLSALDNIVLAAEYAGTPRKDAVERARYLLDLVGLAERENHRPSELSGGQQQRVAIARALINEPTLVLGDEPTGDLDSATSDEIIRVMRRINTETGTTFVLVTHNPEVAGACDRTISMRDGVVADHGLDRCCAPAPIRGAAGRVGAAPVPARAAC